MIVEEPCTTRSDGSWKLVDANGAVVVCRRPGSTSDNRVYHAVDLVAFERDGTVRPACDSQGRTTINWQLRRKSDLEPVWSGCSLIQCWGTHDNRDQQKHGETLAGKLAKMTIEEFDDHITTTANR